MKALRWFLAVGVSAGGLWFALRNVQWVEIQRSLRAIEHPYGLLTIPLAGLAEYILRTERWRCILEEYRVSRPRLFGIVAGAFFFNNVLPFRAGEAARIYWTHRATGRPAAFCAAALVVDRLFDVAVLACLILAVFHLAPVAISPRAARWTLAASAAGLALFVWLSRRNAARPDRKEPGPISRFWTTFKAGAGALRSVPRVLVLVVLSAGIWGVNLWLFRFVAGLFGLHLGWAESGWLLSSLALGVALPSTPGYIGTYEAAGVAALSVLGVSPAQSLPFLLTLHAAQIAGSALWGLSGMRAWSAEPVRGNA